MSASLAAVPDLDAEDDMSGLSEAERLALARNIQNIRYNLGPHAVKALESPDVFELILCGTGQLWLDKVGEGLVPFVVDGVNQIMRPEAAMMLMSVIAPMIGEVLGEASAQTPLASPILEGELPLGGHRFEGVIPPVVERPIFAIRKKAGVIFTLDNYVGRGIMTMRQAEIIRQAIRDRANIMVFGGTSSGKTTLTNAVLDEVAKIYPDHRVLIIEDTRELQCPVECVEYLRTRRNVNHRALLRASLRLRPDRIVFGEVRDAAALDMLKAWNTGHPGGIATGHADSPEEGLERLDEMIQEVQQNSAAKMIGRAVDLVLFIEKDPSVKAGRRLKRILKVDRYDPVAQQYITQDL
ncbi:P-type conjugative transfer ATPase TrbB [Burkholderia sp. LMG 13014]|uniref:P-type conjugative transfer ATPase TrbB n=1 Tax=Burkholderia sp. LMG 13014 TaxID=2709306 RepID=UPI0019638507|nr:P-type conjugative transfer ATPase TrbB [Burkholderia sp. LMG 13014]